MGGGFGGKEFRFVFLSFYCVFVVKKICRLVCVMFICEEDMFILG